MGEAPLHYRAPGEAPLPRPPRPRDDRARQPNTVLLVIQLHSCDAAGREMPRTRASLHRGSARHQRRRDHGNRPRQGEGGEAQAQTGRGCSPARRAAQQGARSAQALRLLPRRQVPAAVHQQVRQEAPGACSTARRGRTHRMRLSQRSHLEVPWHGTMHLQTPGDQRHERRRRRPREARRHGRRWRLKRPG